MNLFYRSCLSPEQCSNKIRHHHKMGSSTGQSIESVHRPPQNEICTYVRVHCTVKTSADQCRSRSVSQHLGISDGGGGSFWFGSGPSLTSHAIARPQLRCTSKWQCMIHTPASPPAELQIRMQHSIDDGNQTNIHQGVKTEERLRACKTHRGCRRRSGWRPSRRWAR